MRELKLLQPLSNEEGGVAGKFIDRATGQQFDKLSVRVQSIVAEKLLFPALGSLPPKDADVLRVSLVNLDTGIEYRLSGFNLLYRYMKQLFLDLRDQGHKDIVGLRFDLTSKKTATEHGFGYYLPHFEHQP